MRIYAFAIIAIAAIVAITLTFTVGTFAQGGTGGPSLVAHWTFEGGLATDVTGNGNDGVVNGPISTPGKIGAAFDFDGSNDYIDAGPIVNYPTGGVSVTAWINADNLANCGASDCRIASKATGTAEQAHYLMLSSINVPGGVKLRFRLKAGGSTSTLISTTDLTNGQWKHVAATYDGAFMRVYVDGAEVGNVAKTGAIDSAPTVPFWIGGNPDGTASRPWDGKIDDVRLYDGALGLAEIEALAGLLPPTPTPIPPTPTPVPPTPTTGPPIDLSGLDYSFSGLTLEILDDGVFVGTDFSDSNLQGASFRNANLTGAAFRHSNMRYADFSDALLEDSDFQGSGALGATFDGARLSRSNLRFDALYASFRNVTLVNGTMDGDLSNSDFTGADLTNTSIGGTAIFTEVDFTNATLLGVNLSDAISLAGVIWANTICPDGTNSDNNGGTCPLSEPEWFGGKGNYSFIETIQITPASGTTSTTFEFRCTASGVEYPGVELTMRSAEGNIRVFAESPANWEAFGECFDRLGFSVPGTYVWTQLQLRTRGGFTTTYTPDGVVRDQAGNAVAAHSLVIPEIVVNSG